MEDTLAQEIGQARKRAMALLQHMDRTEWELRDKLQQRGFSEAAVEDAVEYVRSFHYIDDLRYAIRFVEIYHQQRSMQRLRQDLSRRHVPEEYIEAALDTLEEEDAPALAEAMRKLLKGKELSRLDYQEREKLMAKLYRKGFRVSDIRKMMEQGREPS